ncbi:DciA family protein [Leucothrix arctica]|uniref:DUF721 domain-containing protein n=1 Tax=Leucothrix arctica TaxID=1481894 RepID=A0A317CJW5_9GAMM|nr:DciA family protein [Leucothrix arctica]PWQ98786.1 hypothetical protein DKT75_02985 [Leucothrix arctica]
MKDIATLPNTYLNQSINNIDKLSETVRTHLGIVNTQMPLYVVVKQQVVSLIVESPILANQLKYQQKDILDHINRTFLREFKQINVRLAPPVMQRKKVTIEHKPLSKGITNMLDSIRDELNN